MPKKKKISKKTSKFEELKFVRIDRPDLFSLIPRHLFEQVKDHNFDIDRLYKLVGRFMCDPTTLIFILVDEQSKIKGILWATANLLIETVQVSVLSVDKQYQFGDAIKGTVEFIRSWRNKDNVKIEFITTRPKAYEEKFEKLDIKLKRSKRIILEI